MLRLEKIVKDYVTSDLVTHALKGIDLCFRKNEFVSILGPSGCGKTTLLNIIGGLDKYTDGDMRVNGRSTSEFRDSDWDVYRNHRIGFVFQSYNLIPHQTVLKNVELALTIAGVEKAERVKRAKEALCRVGLKGLYNKKPNQLSGGQSQRVAIARALVNSPEILLADEPTGALDSETSVQIMELIKEISKEKLVIMVTHNPELAKRYSTRIIRLLDGEVISDSHPYSKEEEQEELTEENKREEEKKEVKCADKPKKKRKERAKMSFGAAFKLSAQNLLTKKGRTVLASIASSIGIIGISLVLAISYGVRSYISDMQDDMLSGNPVTVTETAADLTALMQGMTGIDKAEIVADSGFVNVDSMIKFLIERSDQMDNMIINNNITDEYIQYVKQLPSSVATVFTDYGLDVTNNLYTEFSEGEGQPKENFSLTGIRNLYTAVLKETKYKDYASYITSVSEVFMQLPSSEDYILSQYDLLAGDFATEEDEIMIVVKEGSLLTDLLLVQLGYFTQEEFLNIIYREAEEEQYDPLLDKKSFSYEELMARKFYYYPNDAVYSASNNPVTPFTYSAYKDPAEGKELKVAGILRPKEGINYGALKSGFFYTESFAKMMIEDNLHSEIAEYLLAKGEKAFTSMNYNGTDTGITFKFHYTFDGAYHSEATGYVGKPDMMSSLMGGMGMGAGDYYTLSLQNLGGVDRANKIAVYPVDFEKKDEVTAYLDKWNSDEDIVIGDVTLTASEREKIVYTDNLELIIDMVNSFIDIVTYALIGFTALSLLVSCVMIAIITFVSVVERTKEIGVIRALGGRKRDVSFLFNAETCIIGLGSGLIAILVTYIVCAIINAALAPLIGISAIAIFPWHYAVIMVAVSMALTLVSGLFPSRAAAKKDPVVALRTE